MKKLTIRIEENFTYKIKKSSFYFGENKYVKIELLPNAINKLYNDTHNNLMLSLPPDFVEGFKKATKNIKLIIEEFDDNDKIISSIMCETNSIEMEAMNKINIDFLSIVFSKLLNNLETH